MRLSRNLAALYAAAFLRSASIGLLGVVLAVYLSRTGFSATAIGLVLAAGLAGSAVANALTGRYGEALGRRRALIGAAILSSAGGIGLSFVHTAYGLIPLAFACMLNGMGTDRSAAFAVEQAVIPGLVADQRRTWTLSWYNVVLDTSGAVGALAGSLPVVLRNWTGIGVLPAYRWVFLFYTALNLLSAALYLFLDERVESRLAAGLVQEADWVSPETKR